ncbi:PLP-dependent aminotransferase family protein [Marinomonas mediterranea]|uniref:aminotransferase-like domain-containing protein n=1 Tax=Marinomonas mediterranea TaxID=119864 RepID=UPI00234B2A3C|nr:PLP-dependent aminotransferase family protein [Marinomonas mediterranea]WCN08285.1 aminotransferase class I/II-fold pyridoxal phosphate-dependent enzyme [Marinomonas mediterranea]
MSESKYYEIARELEKLIDVGHYPEGSKLPTHRELAEEYSTTAVTVAKAYKLLAEQGDIESFVGRGSFVKSKSHLKQAIHSQHVENEWNFSILQPCFSHHLDALYRQLGQCVREPFSPSLFGYIEDTGCLNHKECGMKWMQHYGLQVRSPEQVLLTNGAQHALSTLIELYSKPGDCIAVEALTYPGLTSIIKALGRRAIGVEMDELGMTPSSLDSICLSENPSLVIAVPSHQNPTAITMPLQRRKEIANIVQKHTVWLLEDDLYSFLNTDVIAPISNFVPEKSFYITSLSKAISPGMRCGFVKVPQSQVQRLSSYIRTMVWHISPITFEVSARLIQSGAAFKLAESQKMIATHRQALARDILDGEILSSQNSSYHIWLTLPDEWEAHEFSMTAKERGMMVSEGHFFHYDDKAINAVRLSLMAIPEEQHLIEGLHSLKRLLDQRRTS